MVGKSYCIDSYCSKSSKSICSLSVRYHIAQRLLSVKLQVRIAQNLSKRNLVLSQNLLTSPQDLPAHLTASVLRKTAELTKIASRKSEERAQRQLKLQGQLLELKRQKIKGEVLIACKNLTLVEHQNLLNECLPKEVKDKCTIPIFKWFW